MDDLGGNTGLPSFGARLWKSIAESLWRAY
jgi:hypothetical protein